MWLELIGYAASILIILSLTMSAVVRLRIINSAGALLYVVYGVVINAWPVAVMNSCVILINAYHLLRIFRASEYFKLLEVPPDSAYLRHFLDFYSAQISTCQPSFRNEPNEQWIPVFVLRNAVPAGVMLGTRCGENRLKLDLDFVIPPYRDFKIARFLFGTRKDFFLSRNIHCIQADKGNEEHTRYLKRMGFQPVDDPPDHYELTL